MEYQIRDYTFDDQAHLQRFFKDVFDDMGFDFDLADKDRDLTTIPELYQTNNGCFLLAEQGTKIVGTIALRHFDPTTLELKRFYVRRDCRGQGLGTALLGEVIAHATAHRTDAICLDTTSRSQAAIRLFKRHGFTDVPRFNDDPVAEFYMKLTLTGANKSFEATA